MILKEFSGTEDSIFTSPGTVVFEERKYVVEGLSPLISGNGIIFFNGDTLGWKGDTLRRSEKAMEGKRLHPLRALKEVSMTLEGNFLPLPSLSFAFYDKTQATKRASAEHSY